MKLVDVLGVHMEVSSGSLLVLLREHDAPHRVLPVAIGENEAAAIAAAMAGEAPPRPLTHDLLATLVSTLDATVEHIEVTELRDGTFVAELAVRSPKGHSRVDSRTSDAIALAMRVDAPLFVSDAVLDEAGTLLPAASEGEIEEEVDRFRNFLEDLDPSQFGDDQPPSGDD